MASSQVPSTEEPCGGAIPFLYTMPPNWAVHETVIGYPDDKDAENEGIVEILEVVSLLEGADIPCCIIGTMALQHYGAPLARSWDWNICVPSTAISTAKELIQAISAKYISFPPSVIWHPAEPYHKYPRFKCVGLTLFFLLVPSEKICFSFDEKDAIVRGRTGLPLPGLRAYVQSLVDSKNLLHLEYIVDGMDLSEEWGNASGLRFEDEILPERVRTKKEWWHYITTSKQTRMGFKRNPKYYKTSYRLHWENYDPTIHSWL